MKRLVAIIILLVSVLSGVRADIVSSADSAYTAGAYDKAISLYNAAAEKGTSASLFYNLGNAYYRKGRLGMAILNYERALRLDPTMEEARVNLAFVNSRITDRPGERGTFVGNALDAVANYFGSNAWAWIAFVAFALAIVGAGAYFFTTGVGLRKCGFFTSLVMLVVTGVSFFFSFRAASIACADDVAIITETSTLLSTSPRTPANRTEEAMLLHEGTRVTILDSVRTPGDTVAPLWLDVQVDNTHRAWINAAHVSRVISPRD